MFSATFLSSVQHPAKLMQTEQVNILRRPGQWSTNLLRRLEQCHTDLKYFNENSH